MARNPKQAVGDTKLPLHLVPASAIAAESLAFLNGALKYGAWNYRAEGIRASTYIAALKRHISRWEEGEEVDEEGVMHLAAVRACAGMLIDGQAFGYLEDDRAPSVDLEGFYRKLMPTVAALRERHKDRKPRHYTIRDRPRRRAA